VSDVERINCIRYFNITDKHKKKEKKRRRKEKKRKEKHIPGTRSE
jgi:hypothetical protein